MLRGAIKYLRQTFPEAEITLIAPGERGRLFQQAGWVDRLSDWDKADYAALFTDNPESELFNVFNGCTRLISFVGADAARKGLEKATPEAIRLFAPARPDEAAPVPIGEWLLNTVQQAFPNAETDVQACLTARIPMPEIQPEAKTGGRPLVIHPGSGSAKKNWPLENYAKLAAMLTAAHKDKPTVIITSGEADGDLGERLQAAIPGAKLHPRGTLAELASQIANAALYIGNDSGVSHLASLVKSESGNKPKAAVIFGASNAKQWSPPEALILDAGENMRNLPPEEAFSRITPLLS